MSSQILRRVYFLRPTGVPRAPVKIGCSRTPTGRLLTLAVWSPFPLEIWGSVPGRTADEQFLHRCFADLHTHHEWFRWSANLHLVIERILAAGTVDVVRGELQPVGTIRTPRCGGVPLSERGAAA